MEYIQLLDPNGTSDLRQEIIQSLVNSNDKRKTLVSFLDQVNIDVLKEYNQSRGKSVTIDCSSIFSKQDNLDDEAKEFMVYLKDFYKSHLYVEKLTLDYIEDQYDLDSKVYAFQHSPEKRKEYYEKIYQHVEKFIYKEIGRYFGYVDEDTFSQCKIELFYTLAQYQPEK